MSNEMNDRVLNAVHENSRAFYEGRKSSAEAYTAIDACALHWANDYPGIVNDTHELFDRLVNSYISEDVDEHRHETYESRQLRRVRDSAEEHFRMKVTADGGAESKWLTLTQAQMDALIRVFEV